MTADDTAAVIETLALKTPKAKTTKPAPKKTPARAAAKATSNGKPERVPEYGIEKAKDVPWNDKKVAVFKTLKKLGAIGGSNALPAAKVAEKAGLSPRDVRHYVYHAKAAGLAGVAEHEGVAGYCYYLTPKGAKLDPTAELKAQNEKKS